MNVVHLFPNSAFTYEFIKKYFSCIKNKNHCFIIYKSGFGGEVREHDFKKVIIKNKKLLSYNNVYFCDDLGKNKVFIHKKLMLCDKFIFHSLFMPQSMITFFALKPWFFKKYIWVIWSGDLYDYIHYTPTFIKDKIDFAFYKFLIQNVSTISTPIYGDYQLAKKYLNIKAKFREFIYAYQFPNIHLNKQSFLNKKEIVVQVGISADKTGGHHEAFQKLHSVKKDNLKITCPLSYGDKFYAREIVKIGEMVFQDNFFPLLEYLEYSKYIEWMQEVDIAILNYQVHRGLGNIYVLLYLGKKLYMNEKSTIYNYLIDNGYIVFSTQKINCETFYQDLSMEEKLLNQSKITQLHSNQYFFDIWSNIVK